MDAIAAGQRPAKPSLDAKQPKRLNEFHGLRTSRAAGVVTVAVLVVLPPLRELLMKLAPVAICKVRLQDALFNQLAEDPRADAV
jgi:hypothetical protein